MAITRTATVKSGTLDNPETSTLYNAPFLCWNRVASGVHPFCGVSVLVDYLQGGSWCARYGRLATEGVALQVRLGCR